MLSRSSVHVLVPLHTIHPNLHLPLDCPLHEAVCNDERWGNVENLVSYSAHGIEDTLGEESGKRALTIRAQSIRSNALTRLAATRVWVSPATDVPSACFVSIVEDVADAGAGAEADLRAHGGRAAVAELGHQGRAVLERRVDELDGAQLLWDDLEAERERLVRTSEARSVDLQWMTFRTAWLGRLRERLGMRDGSPMPAGT